MPRGVGLWLFLSCRPSRTFSANRSVQAAEKADQLLADAFKGSQRSFLWPCCYDSAVPPALRSTIGLRLKGTPSYGFRPAIAP